MKQMNMQGFEVIKIDYDRMDLPGAVRYFKPIIYKDGTNYCCLMGPDPQQGVFGCGDSPQDAVKDWMDDLEERLKTSRPNDKMVQYLQGNYSHI